MEGNDPEKKAPQGGLHNTLHGAGSREARCALTDLVLPAARIYFLLSSSWGGVQGSTTLFSHCSSCSLQTWEQGGRALETKTRGPSDLP